MLDGHLMGAIEDTPIADARAQMETNFFGVLRVCRAVLPVMRERRSGHIVNISSLAGMFGMPFSGIYCASKFAVEGLSESLRMETHRFGLHVVLIEPGDTRSQLPLRRRTVLPVRHASAYEEVLARFMARQAKDEAKAPSPDAVARLVERVVCDPRPAMRYSVGMWDQRMVLPMKRWLPYRWFERMVGAAMGVTMRAALALLGLSLAAAGAGREVAITMDDLPRGGDGGGRAYERDPDDDRAAAGAAP